MDADTGLPVVGMIGAGQLARMTHQAVIPLGMSLRVLAASADDGAARVAADVEVGDHTDLGALRSFAADCDVVTFDHEHVPQEHIAALIADGATVHPGPDALRYAQDKRAMREEIARLGLPSPRWTPISTEADLAEFGVPCVVKTTRGGYDGKGVFVIEDVSDAAELLASDVDLIAEELVRLRRELAVSIARTPSGSTVVYPVVETVQSGGICTEVIAPAPNASPALIERARHIATTIADAVGVTGVMTVELFETADGLLVNELAMRPHNSGHWTIEGAITSQFEQHVRAILDYPLGSVETTAPVTVMANVLGGDSPIPPDERLRRLMSHDPTAKVHLYGKAERPGRKIGHVTVRGDTIENAFARARTAAAILRDGIDTTTKEAT